MVRKCLQAQNTQHLNRHKQHGKHPSEIRRCSQTTTNLTAGLVPQSYRPNSHLPFYPLKITLIWKTMVHLSEPVGSHWPRNLCVRRDAARTLCPRWEWWRLWGQQERGMAGAGLGADGCYAGNATALVALRRQHRESGKAQCFKNKWKRPLDVPS